MLFRKRDGINVFRCQQAVSQGNPIGNPPLKGAFMILTAPIVIVLYPTAYPQFIDVYHGLYFKAFDKKPDRITFVLRNWGFGVSNYLFG